MNNKSRALLRTVLRIIKWREKKRTSVNPQNNQQEDFQIIIRCNVMDSKIATTNYVTLNGTLH